MLSVLNSPKTSSQNFQTFPLHFSGYKQKEFQKANKHLLPSAEKQALRGFMSSF